MTVSNHSLKTSVPVLDRISIRADAQHFITFDKRQMMCGSWKYKNHVGKDTNTSGLNYNPASVLKIKKQLTILKLFNRAISFEKK